MKSFHNFITEASTRGEQGHQALDDYKMSKRTDTPLEVGRLGAKRKKTDAEKKRVKAIGGGKTAPAKDYNSITSSYCRGWRVCKIIFHCEGT